MKAKREGGDKSCLAARLASRPSARLATGNWQLPTANWKLQLRDDSERAPKSSESKLAAQFLLNEI